METCLLPPVRWRGPGWLKQAGSLAVARARREARVIEVRDLKNIFANRLEMNS